jgi:hypothetical protein
MKPARPSAHVTIAGRRLSAAEAALSDLSVWLGRFSHDRVRLVVWPSSKFASAAPGSEMTIELGTEDNEEDVWAGNVSAVRSSPDAVCVEGLAPTAALSSERKSQTYINQGAADVVRDLAGSVTVDDVDTGLQLDYYAVDTRRSVWGHLVDLARIAGAETTISPSGGLRFVEVRSTPASKKFRYRADVLAWQVGPAAAPQPTAYAVHGSASEAGKSKWHWISQQVADKPAQVVGAFHSQSSADALNDAAAHQAQRSAARGRLQLVGASGLRAGDVFTLEDLPDGGPGDLRALAVTHHFSGGRGFWTGVLVEGGGGGPSLGGLP